MTTDSQTPKTPEAASTSDTKKLTPLEKLQAKEAKAKAEIAKAQADLAKVKKEARAMDTRYKILLGAYALKALQECAKAGAEKPIVEVFGAAKKYAGQMPDDLLKWVVERKKDATKQAKAN